jgi:hypothetical protein
MYAGNILYTGIYTAPNLVQKRSNMLEAPRGTIRENIGKFLL